jgi:hypothetical protein
VPAWGTLIRHASCPTGFGTLRLGGPDVVLLEQLHQHEHALDGGLDGLVARAAVVPVGALASSERPFPLDLDQLRLVIPVHLVEVRDQPSDSVREHQGVGPQEPASSRGIDASYTLRCHQTPCSGLYGHLLGHGGVG